MKKIEICLSPELLHLYEVAGKNVVIVDIFRATSTMMAALANGVKSVTPVMDLETCRNMGADGYVIAGERNGQTAPGFELGNSPLAYLDGKFTGKKIAMTTTNGTVAIERSRESAARVVLGAFVNLKATADFLHPLPEDVLILCAGWKGRFNLEDSLYAGALSSLLFPQFDTDCDAVFAMRSLYQGNSHRLNLFLGQASHAKRLQNHNIEKDIEFCLDVDRYDWVGLLEGNELVANLPGKVTSGTGEGGNLSELNWK